MKNKILSLIAVATLGLASCEKKFDSNFDTSYDSKSAAINYASTERPALVLVDLPSTGNTLELDLGNVSVSMPGENKSDIVVTLRRNPTIISDYNFANGTNFVEFDPSAINLPLEIRIPAGQKQAPIKAIVNTNLISLASRYAVQLSIASISGASDVQINPLYKDCMYAVTLKNQYDGIYRGRGAVLRAGDAVLSGPWGPFEVALATTSANAVQWTAAHPWANGGGSQLPAGYEPRLTVATGTNGVTVTSPGAFLTNNPGYTSRYEPATKTFFYSASWGAGPASRLMTDTLTYLRPR